MDDFDGARLDDDEVVVRLWRKSKNGAISPVIFKPSSQIVNPEAFVLSSTEKLDTEPKLSVFARSKTSLAQACAIWNKVPFDATMFLALKVNEIRSIRPIPEDARIKPLNVVWHVINNQQPGIDGHAGITGLAQDHVANERQRKSLRLQLADNALIIDEDIEDLS